MEKSSYFPSPNLEKKCKSGKKMFFSQPPESSYRDITPPPYRRSTTIKVITPSPRNIILASPALLDHTNAILGVFKFSNLEKKCGKKMFFSNSFFFPMIFGKSIVFVGAGVAFVQKHVESFFYERNNYKLFNASKMIEIHWELAELHRLEFWSKYFKSPLSFIRCKSVPSFGSVQSWIAHCSAHPLVRFWSGNPVPALIGYTWDLGCFYQN